jgi:hypothetical protein
MQGFSGHGAPGLHARRDRRTPTRVRVSWRYGALLTLGALTACGLNAAGELATDLDAGSQAPTDDGGNGTGAGHDARSDAKHPGDATVPHDAKADGKGGSNVDAPLSIDGATPSDAPTMHDGEPTDAPHDSTGPKDGNPGDASSADASSHDGEAPDASGHDAAATDAGHDASEEAGVDASGPPGGCFLNYSCGSSKCSCNQLCDDGTTCGACLPHYGSCLGTCDSDFSSILSCGGCGNVCLCLNPLAVKCNLSGGTYTCGC